MYIQYTLYTQLLKDLGLVMFLNEVSCAKVYINTKTVHSYTYEWEKLQHAIWWNSPAF